MIPQGYILILSLNRLLKHKITLQLSVNQNAIIIITNAHYHNLTKGNNIQSVTFQTLFIPEMPLTLHTVTFVLFMTSGYGSSIGYGHLSPHIHIDPYWENNNVPYIQWKEASYISSCIVSTSAAMVLS